MNIFKRKIELLEIELNDLERKCLHVEEKIILLKDIIEKSNEEDNDDECLSQEELNDIDDDYVFNEERIKSSLYEKGSVDVTKM